MKIKYSIREPMAPGKHYSREVSQNLASLGFSGIEITKLERGGIRWKRLQKLRRKPAFARTSSTAREMGLLDARPEERRAFHRQSQGSADSLRSVGRNRRHFSSFDRHQDARRQKDPGSVTRHIGPQTSRLPSSPPSSKRRSRLTRKSAAAALSLNPSTGTSSGGRAR